jgi:hypothetical protein
MPAPNPWTRVEAAGRALEPGDEEADRRCPDERPERLSAVTRRASDENRRESGKREDQQADRRRATNEKVTSAPAIAQSQNRPQPSRCIT